jgi:hypothetical protein
MLCAQCTLGAQSKTRMGCGAVNATACFHPEKPGACRPRLSSAVAAAAAAQRGSYLPLLLCLGPQACIGLQSRKRIAPESGSSILRRRRLLRHWHVHAARASKVRGASPCPLLHSGICNRSGLVGRGGGLVKSAAALGTGRSVILLALLRGGSLAAAALTLPRRRGARNGLILLSFLNVKVVKDALERQRGRKRCQLALGNLLITSEKM